MSIIQHIRELQPNTIVLSLTLGLCAVLVFHTTAIWMGSSSEIPSEKSRTTTALNFNVDNIASRNVFARDQSNSNAMVAVAEPNQTSGDDLVLQAIFESTQASDSKAIISISGAAGKNYTVGDALDSGASIDSIERDRVVLNTPRGKEALVFRAPSFASSANDFHQQGSSTQPAVSASSFEHEKEPVSKMEAIKQRLAKLREQSRSQ